MTDRFDQVDIAYDDLLSDCHWKTQLVGFYQFLKKNRCYLQYVLTFQKLIQLRHIVNSFQGSPTIAFISYGEQVETLTRLNSINEIQKDLEEKISHLKQLPNGYDQVEQFYNELGREMACQN